MLPAISGAILRKRTSEENTTPKFIRTVSGPRR